MGFDLRDGSYAVTLAQRLVRGEIPLKTEVSPHIFGALPVAPVLWVWRTLFGDTGIVLVARLTFVLLAALVAVVSWRAVSPTLGRTASALAVLAAVLCIPYNLLVVSYNTLPALMFLLATAAGVAVIFGGSAGWGVVCGTAAVGIGIGYFALLPAAALLVLCVLALAGYQEGVGLRWPARRLLAAVLLPAVALGAGFLFWITVVPGWQAVQDAYALMSVSQKYGSAMTPWDIWEFFLARSRLLPACFGLAMLAVVLPLRAIRRAGLLLASLAGLAWWSGQFGEPNAYDPTAGRFTGALALMLILVMFLPAVIWLFRYRDKTLIQLFILGALPSLTGFAIIVNISASGPSYGAYAAAFPGMLLFLMAFIADVSSKDAPNRLSWVTSAMVPMAFMLSLVAVVFNEGPVSYLTYRETSGPVAGIAMGADSFADQQAVAQLMADCPGSARGLWTLGAPGAYLWSDVSSDVPQYWVELDGVQQNLEVLQARPRQPGCVLVPADLSRVKGGDAVQRWLDQHYYPIGSAQLHIYFMLGVANGEFTMYRHV